MRLNVGAGGDIRADAVNVDIVDLPGIDVVHDLDVTPWPFADETFAEVLALDIFEHVDRPLQFVAECWRVLEPGGRLAVRAPRAGTWCAATDPTHRRGVTENTFDFWVPGTLLHRPGYAHGCHFTKRAVRAEGDNIVFELGRV